VVAVACFSQWIGKTDRVFLLAKAKRKERWRLHRAGLTRQASPDRLHGDRWFKSHDKKLKNSNLSCSN